MKALILAAGYATRLYPLTKDRPKPLLEVKGAPIIEHIARRVAALDGMDEIIVVVNRKFVDRFRAWKERVDVGNNARRWKVFFWKEMFVLACLCGGCVPGVRAGCRFRVRGVTADGCRAHGAHSAGRHRRGGWSVFQRECDG